MNTLEDRATELYEVIRGCTLCTLAATRTLAVPGEGPLHAEVMCIGEAPGMNEDKQGRPFVGASGQFLSELLGAAGLTRDQVYICNVLKCRPPNNRDPLPNEIDACAEYLDLQLDMVDPLVVVTLGRFSMSKWFPQQAISRIHGSVKEADGRLIVPMYHPAAALHQGNLRQVLLDDFAKLPAILDRARARRIGDHERSTQRPAAGPSLPSPLSRLPSVAGEGEPTAPPARSAGLGANEPPWEDAPRDGIENVEFDPGDHLPAQPAPARRRDSPSVAGEGGSLLPGETTGTGAEQRLAEWPATRNEPTLAVRTPEPGSNEELSATQEAAPAAKSTQLSLFD